LEKIVLNYETIFQSIKDLLNYIAVLNHFIMRIYLKLHLIILLIQGFLTAWAAPYYFKQYQVQDGLSNNIVNCCIQDNNGFMWFGTRDGLNRFDGYSFYVYRADSDQPHSIGNNNIQSFAIGPDSSLWIGTIRGLYKYIQLEDKFELIPFTKDLQIGKMFFNAEGELWLVLDRKLVKYNEHLDFQQTYNVPDNSPISTICITPLGKIWVALSNAMLYEFNEETGGFDGFDLYQDRPDVISKNITSIYPTPDGNKLFIGSYSGGVKLFDLQTRTSRDILRYDKNHVEITVHGFLQVNSDEVWITTESGLFIYNLKTDSYQQINSRPLDPYSLSTNALSCICLDNENGIWLGAYAGGINYYSPFQPFEKYYSYPGDNGLQGELIHDICTDDYNNLWIATEDAGINKLDRKTGKYTNYSPNNGEKSISHKNIHGLVADKDKLWVGSIYGINVIDIPSGKLVKTYNRSNSASWREHVVVSMKKLKNGKLYVGTSLGMFYYNEISDQFDFMPQFPNRYRIQCIHEDQSGTILAGTVGGGVYYYNSEEDNYGQIEHDTIGSYNSNTVNDIFEDKYNNLWFATLEGVWRKDSKTEALTHFSIHNGMPSNIMFKILDDSTGTLWISTANGLVSLDPETEEITVYKQDHGLITNQFNYNSGWKDDDGRLYFGMVKGMISFKPEDLKLHEKRMMVYLTNILIYNKTIGGNIPIYPVTFSDKIELNHDWSTFSIDFTALSYIAPNITEYAYILEGYESNWTYLSGSHRAYYTKLPPGQYNFKVKAANVSGVWNDVPTVLKIIITPPWWQSNIAKLIYFILIVACFIYLYHILMQQNKKEVLQSIKILENEKEKELYQAKISFFINIAHEIRTPLTLIKSPLDKVMRNTEVPKEVMKDLIVVNKNSDRLLALVNQLLDFRKTEIKGYSLNFVKTDIRVLIQDIYDRFKNAAEKDGLSFEIRIETGLRYAYVDKEACTKIISNLLTNAFKYARSFVLITLTFPEEEGLFVIDVSNDGESVPNDIKEKIFEPFFRGEDSAHKPGTGLGLPLAKSLAEMHRGSLTIEDSAELSTIFRLCIPVNQPNSIQLQEEERINPVIESSIYESDNSRPTILIVEDNVEMRNYIGSELNAYYNIITANNGKEALHKLEEYSIQLIVSDIMMPVMDGFTFLKDVKTNIEYSHIPVIMLTAKNTVQSRLEGLELGADAYIEKPFSLDLLLAQIVNLLTNRENIRNSYSQSPVVHLKSMAYTKADEHFLEKLNEIIQTHISNINLDVDMIADLMNLSRPTLYRKISALSNLTPNELIRIARLKKAAMLIMQKDMKIYEISEAVGFSSQSYFSRSFMKQFGMTPSEYATNNKK